MHDCRKLEIDELLLDELDETQKQRFFNDLRDCPNCQSELVMMSKTFDGYKHFSKLDEPSEIYWQNFESNLQRQISGFAPQTNVVTISVWRKISVLFATSIRVPLPVAAVILLIFATLAIFALRSQTQQMQIIEVATPPQIIEKIAPAQNVATTIEKPVIREKIVLRDKIIERKIYVSRRESSAKLAPKTMLEARNKVDLSKNPTLNLAEFKPAPTTAFKIIKTNADEIK